MVSPGLCPLRALPWSLGVCQTRSLTLRPKLRDKPLGLSSGRWGVLLSTLWAVPWEQLSAKNYLLDYDPREPGNISPPGLQSQAIKGRTLIAVPKAESPDVKSGRQMCVQILSRSYWCFGLRQRESAKMVPSGEIKGGEERIKENKGKRERWCLPASIRQRESMEDATHRQDCFLARAWVDASAFKPLSAISPLAKRHFGLHSQVFWGLVCQVPVLIVGVPKMGYKPSLLREKIQDLSFQLWVTVPGMEFMAKMYLCLCYPLLYGPLSLIWCLGVSPPFLISWIFFPQRK